MKKDTKKERGVAVNSVTGGVLHISLGSAERSLQHDLCVKLMGFFRIYYSRRRTERRVGVRVMAEGVLLQRLILEEGRLCLGIIRLRRSGGVRGVRQE